MSIQNALNTAIYSRLTGGTVLTALLTNGTASIYFMQAPDNLTDADYVVWNYQAETDDNLDPTRMKQVILNVKGVSRTGPARAGSIDAQIDALLHHSPLSASGWANIWIAREEGFQTVEIDQAGTQYFQSGAMYRAILDQQ